MEVITISFSYKRLFKLLLDKDMTKEELRIKIGASSTTIAKLAKGENVSLEVLNKICNVLNCKIEDIVEHIKEERENT